MKLDNGCGKIIDIAKDLDSFFSWIPCSPNQAANRLAKQGAMHLALFIGNFLPSVYNVFLSSV